ncbi:hypothetical protein DESC_40126 [Desulfosarcina cetonica]|nr:hypothetical protein DESC_40126 [Desulfosarcina cetonica]
MNTPIGAINHQRRIASISYYWSRKHTLGSFSKFRTIMGYWSHADGKIKLPRECSKFAFQLNGFYQNRFIYFTLDM